MVEDPNPSLDHVETIAMARARLLSQLGLSEADYDAPWIHVDLPIPVVFPNWPARAVVVRQHDLNHLLTGYGTDVRGEALQAAWEAGSGFGQSRVVWFYELLALAPGLLLHPLACFEAWRRGRGCRSFYTATIENVDSQPVSEARRRFGVDARPSPLTVPDVLRFSGIAALSLVHGTVMLLLGTVLVPGLWLRYLLRRDGDGHVERDA